MIGETVRETVGGVLLVWQRTATGWVQIRPGVITRLSGPRGR